MGMEFTFCSPYQGHNLCGKLLVLWSDYSSGENNESSVGKKQNLEPLKLLELDLPDNITLQKSGLKS